jgi:hypothetical protein
MSQRAHPNPDLSLDPMAFGFFGSVFDEDSDSAFLENPWLHHFALECRMNVLASSDNLAGLADSGTEWPYC